MFTRVLLMVCALVPALSYAQVTQVVTTTDGTGAVTGVATTTTTGPAATTAQINAATAVVPGSGITPSTTLGGSAGQQETNLLETVAVGVAVRQLSQTAPFGNRNAVLVVNGPAVAPDATPWLTFDQHALQLVTELKLDDDLLEQEIQKEKEEQERKAAHGGIRPLIAPAVLVAIPVIQKILSYAAVSYSEAGVSLTVDDYLLEVALMKGKPNWIMLGQRGTSDAPEEIKNDLDAIQSELTRSHHLVSQAAPFLALNQGSTQKSDKDEATRITGLETNITADVGAINTFLSSVNGGANASTTMSTVIQALQYKKALDKGDGVLFVKMHSAAGSVLTRTTFWSNLGFGMPVSDSVAVVVSYVYYAPGGQRTAGIFSVATPYQPADTVGKLLEAYSNGKCNSPASKPEGAAKYCPVVYGQ